MLKDCFKERVRKVASEPDGLNLSKSSRFIPVTGYDLEPSTEWERLQRQSGVSLL